MRPREADGLSQPDSIVPAIATDVEAPRSGTGERRASLSLYEGLLHVAYDLFYLLCALVLSPYIVFKFATTSRFRAGLVQRLGFVPRRETDRPCLWVHGVSVGEILAASRFVREFESRFPDWMIVLSTTTKTGHSVAARHFPGRPLIYYPFDLSLVVGRVLGRIRPSLVALMELEIWPNLLLSTSRRGIPVLLLNGRISEKSFRGYRILQRFLPEPLSRISLYCVQNAVYGERLSSLGVPQAEIHITGSMKFDTIETGDGTASVERVRSELGLKAEDPVLVGGSTHPGEEGWLLDALAALRAESPRLRLVLAPRHPERIPEVETLVVSRGFSVRRRTAMRDDPYRANSLPDVILIDTMGELGRIYHAASVVFVGGSLIPHGGQNMLEAAGLGKAVVFGPHVFNFQDSVEILLRERAAVQLRGVDDLLPELRRLLRDPSLREEIGARARDAIRKNQGASLTNLDIIARRYILPSAAPPAKPCG